MQRIIKLLCAMAVCFGLQLPTDAIVNQKKAWREYHRPVAGPPQTAGSPGHSSGLPPTATSSRDGVADPPLPCAERAEAIDFAQRAAPRDRPGCMLPMLPGRAECPQGVFEMRPRSHSSIQRSGKQTIPIEKMLGITKGRGLYRTSRYYPGRYQTESQSLSVNECILEDAHEEDKIILVVSSNQFNASRYDFWGDIADYRSLICGYGDDPQF